MCDKNVQLAKSIAKLVDKAGGTTYYIGGYIRDKLRGKSTKDIDIEVHNITPKQLENVLDSLGTRISIGENFGIYNMVGYTLDIAMPRKENNRGSGHRDFDICVDPHIGTYKAAMRRDFTINALMQNVLTEEIIDHFGGIDDIKHGIIRHIDHKTFIEDPLRVLRAAQFAARFEYKVADETTDLCREMNLSHLSSERIISEIEKALLMSDRPSVFFKILKDIKQLDIWFPELKNIIDIPQNPENHAEGDVWTHTMMVVDAASKYKHRVNNPLGFMLTALVHDFGKAICTEIINGKIHAYNHETIGLPLVKTFMQRLTNEKKLISYVLNLTEYHMKPNKLAANNSSIKSTNKLFDASVDPEALICLATSDRLGRIAKNEKCVPYEDFLYDRLNIYRDYLSQPYVMGQDLIDAGLTPSSKFSIYLNFAHKLRLAGIDKQSALKQTLALARKEEKMKNNV